jgi:hypothetical protein
VPVSVTLRCMARGAGGALEGTGVGFGMFTIRRRISRSAGRRRGYSLLVVSQS